MPLADRAARRPHTIRAFRAAAGVRYREATRLANAGHRLGAIYLYGYVVEMVLKASYFRLRGWAPTQPIAAPADLIAAKNRAAQIFHLGAMWPGNLHDLGGWAILLVHERIAHGHPFPRAFAIRLRRQVHRVYRQWRESLRYHEMTPRARELDDVRAAVNWLLAHYRRL